VEGHHHKSSHCQIYSVHPSLKDLFCVFDHYTVYSVRTMRLRLHLHCFCRLETIFTALYIAYVFFNSNFYSNNRNKTKNARHSTQYSTLTLGPETIYYKTRMLCIVYYIMRYTFYTAFSVNPNPHDWWIKRAFLF
jgi:hypothetical protein